MDTNYSIRTILNSFKQSKFLTVLFAAALFATLGYAAIDSNSSETRLNMLSSEVKFSPETNLPSNSLPQTSDELTIQNAPSWQIQENVSCDAQWKTVRMKVTAYCPCRKCCGRHSDGYTASMHKIHRGDRFVASDKKFSFGTEMIIPGYNHSNPVKIEDRGRLIKGNKIDVFFNSHRQAMKWGVKYIDVKVRVN